MSLNGSSTAITYDLIARDLASKSILHVAASYGELKAAVTKSFTEQEAVIRRANSRILASLKAEEAALAKARAEADKYGKSTAFLNSHKEQLDKVATGLAGIGAAAAVGFGAAVKQSAEFNASMARVGAFSDDARGHMGQLRDLAMKVGASIGYSGTQSAQAMEEMVKAGVSAQNMINGGLKGTLQLAAAGQIDVAQATEIATAAMTQFGLTGRDIPHVADLLAAGADKALGGVGDLGEAMKYAGTQSKQYGVSIEDTVGVLADFASHGQLGEMAGAQFAQMLSRLGAPTKKAAAEMKSLGLNVYDSNGNFVNMTTLAGRLQSAFEKLTPAQRNAAEQTIFGQRAMRGANILYQSGAQGVSNWISKVNDQGFAAQTAGRKMDSFAGDLQKLKAQLDNAFIGTGNGAQGPLRQVTQGLTAIIGEYNKLPDAAKSAVGGVAGSLAVFGLGGAATVKVIQGVAAMRKAFADLGLSQRAVSGLKVGFGIGAIALAGVSTAIGIYEQRAEQAKQDTSDFAQAFSTMSGKVDLATGALNKNVRASAVNILQQRGAFDAAQKLGLSYSTVTDAVLGVQSAQDKVNAAIDKAKRSSNDGSIAAAGYGHAQSDAAIDAEKLGNAIGYTSDKTRAGLKSDQQRRAGMKQSTGTTKEAGNAQQVLAGSVFQAINAQKAQTDQLKKNRQAMIDDANAVIGMSNDQIAFKQSMADAAKAAKDNKHTLDLNTQAGRDNRTALNNLAGASLTYIQDLIKNKASTDKVKAATQEARGEFIKVATAMGGGGNSASARAKELADKYGLIPKDVVTQIKQPGMGDAQKNLDLMDYKVRHLQNKTVLVNYKVTTGGKAVAVSSTGSGLYNAGAKATGGTIVGPGSGTSDDVPIMASNGEYVIRAAAANKIGVGRLNYMNQTGTMPGFATGGAVDRNLIIRTMLPGGALAALGSYIAGTSATILSDINKATPSSFPGLSGGTSGANEKLGLAMMMAAGWPASQWPALKALWTRESGWNANAVNSSSGAYGIPQALGHGHPFNLGDAGPQIAWGLNYIRGRYGSPAAAWGHETNVGWYANGTNNARPGLAIVGENGPEAVIMRGGEQVIPHMAAGGPVSASAFGSSSLFSVAAIVALMRAISQPMKSLASLTSAMRSAQRASEVASHAATVAHRPFAAASAAYTRAVNSRDNLRAGNARQLKNARDLVATREHEIAVDKKDHASKAALARAEDRLTAARAKESKVSRDNTAQSAAANAKVTATSKAKTAAQTNYDKALATATTKSNAYKTAQQNLAQEQQAVADSAKQVSSSFTGLYNQPTGSIMDLFTSMNKGAADITAFGRDIDALRKKGLGEGIIDQIISQAQSGGVASGISLAGQALNGGSYLIGLLNKSAQQLQDAGNIFGYKTATAKGTGYASGTNWASPGIHDIAENGAELVVGRQARRFFGGEMVQPMGYKPDNNVRQFMAPAQDQPSELHVHFHGVTDTHAAANEITQVLRKDTRFRGGVKIGLRTRQGG